MIRGGIVMLKVSYVGRAVRFYVETLGMKLVDEAADGSAVIDAGEGFLIALQAGKGDAVGVSGVAITFYPKVPIDEAIAIYENRGVTFATERTDRVVTARFCDPDANPLCLTQAV